ncbi:MAG: hypothetical protein KAS57_03075 [Gammaproteobacteria bacterium]|nr:hypothetical protein [Gammaproteobacteria bacterium]
MYDFTETIQRIENLDYLDMVAAIQAEIRTAETNAYSGKSGCVKHREMGAPQYASRMKALAFFLGNSVIPGGANDSDIAIFKTITQKLVKKGQLKPEALDVFNFR